MKPVSLILGCALFIAGAVAGMAYEVGGLRCEGSIDPLGVDARTPRLSWQIKDPARESRQAAYAVEVASSREALLAGTADLWVSGRVTGDQTHLIPYGGSPLRSTQRVYWRVRSWSVAGPCSPWSEPATWTMGQLQPDDWVGIWVEAVEERPSLLFRRTLTLEKRPTRAVVHVCGLGHYQLRVNGNPVGTQMLSPGWTDYAVTTLYDTLEVTHLLQEGENAIGLMLGNGMYHVERAGRFAKFEGSFGRKRAILDLVVEFDDGTSTHMGTDSRWKTNSGPITFSSIYGGENFDARLEPDGWDRADFDDALWSHAVVSDSLTKETLRGHGSAAPPLAPVEVKESVRVLPLAAEGGRVHDFGQNTSYAPRLRVSGPAGSRVQMIPAELLFPDGYPSRSSMGGIHRGTSWWEYTKGTDTVETWTPSFFTIGSRYMQVQTFGVTEDGPLPVVESLEGLVVHSTAAPVGFFETTNSMINQIRDLVRWAQRSNMVSVLTDCPHREKLGWLEQYHLNGPSIRYEFDVARIFRKAMRDMRDAQEPSGMVPNIAPEYTRFSGTFRSAAEWGAAFIEVPWQQYLFEGEDGLIVEHYAAMARYFAYLDSRDEGQILSEGLGDWYDLGPKHGSGRAQLTLPPLTATAFFYQNAKRLGMMATLLGKETEAKRYFQKAEAIRERFNAVFFNATEGHYGSNSQAGNAIPLVMGMVEESERGRVFAALVKDVEDRGYATTAGDVGFRYVLTALSDGGRDDIIYRMINQSDTPGYGYQIRMGATALTEAWDARPTSSHNHFMLGHIMEWFHGRLLGIRPDPGLPGFKRTVLDPRPVPGLEGVRGHRDGPYGRISVSWKQAPSGDFDYSVTIPANTDAILHLPVPAEAIVEEGGRPLAEVSGVTVVDRTAGRMQIQLESGSYHFRTRPWRAQTE